MKKVAVVALLSCFSVQAQEGDIRAYLRASINGALTDSEFSMDYEIYDPNGYQPVKDLYDDSSDGGNFPGARPFAAHKQHSICRVGAGLSVGIRGRLEDNWFIGGEFNYSWNRVNYQYDFTEAEDAECSDHYSGSNRISYIDIKHKDEMGFACIFGKEFYSYDIYGIFGVVTKKVDMKYGLDENHKHVDKGFEVNPGKRVYGMVFGLGASYKVNDNVAFSLEYRYKIYNSGTDKVDCRAYSKEAFASDHDNSDRSFKTKSDKHELSLGITFSV